MLNLLTIPTNCICDLPLVTNKLLSTAEDEIKNTVSDPRWIATIKPSLAEVEPVVSEHDRFEEIQIIHITISDPSKLYEICRAIFKSVKYPCLIIIEHNQKFILAASTFMPGKVDYSENIIRFVFVSHWIHPDLISPGAQKFISEINEALNSRTDLKTMHKALRDAIQRFALSGTSRAHVQRLIKDMMGGLKTDRTFEEIMRFCSVYKLYQSKSLSAWARYNAADRCANYTFVHDYEDVWYCFMKDDQLRQAIEHRRYRDIEDLVYCIESKEW